MTPVKTIRVALVGLEFGRAFVPLYLRHPNVQELAICDLDERKLTLVGDGFGITRRFTHLEEILASRDYDAVHLVTPIPLHAEQTVAVLESGKHCACAVPMGSSLEELKQIVAVQRRVGKNYMMMETAVYTRAFLFVKELLETGALGAITFLRGAHLQDMEGGPSYWMGLPPMHYITHAIAPLLALARTRTTKVHCFGSGELRQELQAVYGNPYPVETAIFRLAGTPVAAEVTRSLFQTARSFTESFAVYGPNKGFEWQQLEHEDPVLFTMEPRPSGRGRPVRARRISVPYRPDLLPAELAPLTYGGGHGGSHPHLVHEFVRSIVEERPPAIDAVTAADWTEAGICAHASAMRDGEAVAVPSFA
jgi:predicted dehydrogenase